MSEDESDKKSEDIFMEETQALVKIADALRDLPSTSRSKILNSVLALLGENLGPASTQRHNRVTPTNNSSHIAPLNEDREITVKEFLKMKQPKTVTERVTCLAYYLTHYRETAFFKTSHITKLNTEGAQTRLANPSKSVDNTARSGYIVAATKGQKQITSIGEDFVQALPDHAAARALVLTSKPKRKKTKKKAN